MHPSKRCSEFDLGHIDEKLTGPEPQEQGNDVSRFGLAIGNITNCFQSNF